jgi:hypothetical protein
MGVPAAGDADSSLIEYPFAEPFTNAHGMGASTDLAKEAKASTINANRARIRISPP